MYKRLYEYFMQELRSRKINPQQSFYHYTSSNGLNGILNNKKIKFSNTKFLNDEQERYYTYKLLIDEIDKMDNSEFNENLKNYYSENTTAKNNVNTNYFEYEYYIACFSNEKDSLGLWNYYTKCEDSTGYNIEFNKNELIQSLELSPMDIHGQVIYDEKEQRKLIKNILKRFNEEYLKVNDTNAKLNFGTYFSLLINFYSLFFKHPAFKNEEEYRIAIGKNRINNNKFKCLFRPYKDLFIPYFEKKFPKTCIKSITISPTQKQKITQDSIRKMLEEMQYKQIEVKVSNIPLRY